MLDIRTLLFLPFILIYLFPILGIILLDGRKLFFSAIIIPILIFCIILFNYKKILKYFNLFFKFTLFKYFLLLYVWIISVSILAVIKGYYSFNYFLIAVLIGFFCRGFLLYLYPMLVFPQSIKLKSLIKLFVSVIYIMLIVGIIELFASLLNIKCILNIINIFANTSGFEGIIVEAHSSIPRIRSFTAEPGAFAAFITLFLPIIYKMSMSKFKIYKNILINNIIKMTIIPLAIVCLIFTQSPIWLIFSIVITIYIYKKLFLSKFNICVLIIIMCIAVSFCLLCYNIGNIDLSNTYLSRIINVFTSITHKDFDEFLSLETSLATRVINWTYQYQLALKYPIFGIGLFNRGEILINHIQHSSLPYTYEISQNIQNAANLININMTTSSQLLYQTGFVGFFLYCIYMIKSISYLDKIKNAFIGIEKVFVISFTQYFKLIFIFSLIYGISFMNATSFCAMGIANALVLHTFNNIKRNQIRNKYGG